MNNELYVDNLHRIISKSGKKAKAGSRDLAENFFQKIADDIYLTPPLYSRGFKIKDMLWNYFNLKDDARSQFEGHILAKWKSFQETLKEATRGTTMPPNGMEKTSGQPDKNQETTQPDPAQKEIRSHEKTEEMKSTDVSPGIEAPSTSADKRDEIIKPVVHKTALQKPVPEHTVPQEAGAEKVVEKRPALKKVTAPPSAPGKITAPVPATKKHVNRKKTASVSAKKIPEKRKRQADSKTLKTDVQELTRDMRALEKKIEKMIKTFDSIAGLNVAGSKTVKKTVP